MNVFFGDFFFSVCVIDQHKVVSNCEVKGVFKVFFSFFFMLKSVMYTLFLSRYFIEPLPIVVKAARLLLFVTTSFAHLENCIVEHSH